MAKYDFMSFGEAMVRFTVRARQRSCSWALRRRN